MSIVSIPVSNAATLDEVAWSTSFDEVANPAGLLESSADDQQPAQLFSGTNLSRGSLAPLIVAATASAENTGSGEVAANLADGDPATKWFAGSATAWAQYRLDSGQQATRYVLTTANDAVNRSPKAWQLQGSNNGTSWTVLDERADQLTATDGAPSYFSRHTYDIPANSQGSYTYYRLNVTQNNGSGSAIQLGDWELINDEATQTPDVTPWQTVIHAGPSSSRVAKTNVGFTGTKALRYNGYHTANGTSSATNVLYTDLDLEIGETTELSYKIFPNLDEFELAYPSTYVAVDVEYTDASGANPSRLSVTPGLTDQYGYGVSARDQGRAKTLYGRQWNSVRVDLSSLEGKKITKVLLTYDNPDGSAISAASGWVDDITLGAAVPIDNSDGSLTNYVDTRRGTNSNGEFSRGNNFPATALPNGFNLYTPFTEGSSNRDLYKYQQSNNSANKPRLQGLGVSHEPSRWISDRNQLQVMPSITSASTPDAGLVARELPFDRANELAQPDQYSVTFDNGITAQIAPADHSAIFRFEFPSSAATGTVFVDQVQTNASVTISGNAFSGWTDGSTAGATRMFVYGQFDQPATSSGQAASRSNAKYFRFATTNPVELKLATSLISVAQAQKNLELELTGKDFEAVQQDAQAAWDERLGVIDVTGASDVEKINLYSNLYRLNLYPNAQHENTGTAANPQYQYASPVNATSGAPTATATNAPIKTGKMFVNNGFWDTYRTAWPLYSYLYPQVAEELIDGFIEQYRQGGWVARWSAPGYDNQMTGTSSDASFADAYMAGALGTELAEEAYEAALKNATALSASNVKSDGNYGAEQVGRKGFATSPFLGYTPASQDQSVSWGLEGLVNDYAIGKMAQKLSTDPGVTETNQARYAEEAEYFLARAEDYVNLFDDRIGDPDDADTPLGFFTARNADGSWLFEPGSYNLSNTTTVYNPEDWDSGRGTIYNNHTYTETNGWNFAFHAPYDVDGLAALYGGKDGLTAKLDTFFATQEKAETRKIHETYEARDVRMGQWGASNQVSFHIPYIYAAAGNPSRTQEVVREAVQRLFVGSEIGQGYPGDEDNGAMASWYVFSALGFFPLAVGSGEYVLGSPLYDNVVISPLGSTDSLTISASGNSDQNVFVQSATLDGSPLTSATVDQSALIEGSHTLEFEMGSSPSSWGAEDIEAADPTPSVDVAHRDYATVSVSGSSQADRLIDDNSTTVLTLPSQQSTVNVNLLAGPARVGTYTITNGSAAGSADPASWRLEASNDGNTWTTVDERSGETFAWRSQIRPFQIDTPGSYKRYRLVVTASDSGGPASIGEFELLTSEKSDASGDLDVTAVDALTASVGTEFTAVLAGVSGAAEADDLTATVNYGDGPQVGDISSAPSGGFVVRAPRDFTKAGRYDVSIEVAANDVRKSVTTYVDVTMDLSTVGSMARAANLACFAEIGVGGDCDGQGYAYNKAKVQEAEVQFGVRQHIELAGETFGYTIVDAAPGEPDTLTGIGQIVKPMLAPGVTKLAVLGMANEGEQAMRYWINYTDGSSQSVTIRFGDWVANATAPIANNTVVFNAPGRLDGPVEEDTVKNAAVYATNPVSLQTDESGAPKEIDVLLIENQGSSVRNGKTHIVAFADNGEDVPEFVVEAADSSDVSTKVNTAVHADLAAVSGGREEYVATVNWGDGTGLEDLAVADDGSVSGTHTYSRAGTFSARVTVADGEYSRTVVRTFVVAAEPIDPGPGPGPDPTPKPTLTVPVLSKSNQTFNSVKKRRATISTVLTGVQPGTTVTFVSGNKTLGRAAVTRVGSRTSATLVVPAKLAIGTYRSITARTAVGSVAYASKPTSGALSVVRAKTKKVTVKAKRFKKGTKPKVTVRVAKLSNGRWAAGKVRIRVGKKVVRTVRLKVAKKGKISVKLPKRYQKPIKVSARFVPKAKAKVAPKASKKVTVKLKR